MFIRHTAPHISAEMSRPEAEKPLQSGESYPLRRLSRFFAVVGFATAFYASALVAIAFDSAIIEF